MNAVVTHEVSDPLAVLRQPFPAHHISKLPKPTKAQTDTVKADYTKGVRCQVCGSWHHPQVIHLDYVGHAALTDRLLDTDPSWFWEPLAYRDGLPAFDGTGGLWIRLTVCGVTRLGYGNAVAKPGQDAGSREKEVIGDALRNAAMRFGAALDLWHKGDLHLEDVADPEPRKAAGKAIADMRNVTPAPETEAPVATRHNANQCKTRMTVRPDTGEEVTKAALAAKLAHEMTDIMEVTELLAWRHVWEPEVSTWPQNWEVKMWSDWDIHMGDLRRLTADAHMDPLDAEMDQGEESFERMIVDAFPGAERVAA